VSSNIGQKYWGSQDGVEIGQTSLGGLESWLVGSRELVGGVLKVGWGKRLKKWVGAKIPPPFN